MRNFHMKLTLRWPRRFWVPLGPYQPGRRLPLQLGHHGWMDGRLYVLGPRSGDAGDALLLLLLQRHDKDENDGASRMRRSEAAWRGDEDELWVPPQPLRLLRTRGPILLP